ncbi:hypothetical protein GQ55_9G640500 [Panicum hallii var. hallii]|uniref:Sugar phosphate transporter domain-containing protein n=1 Tax=Panicum hallii var. hallii TaxID=1504633 RepID=A0A2T7CIJ2_9POAL|nr:hypothetical protein GQ55_9G640500 [Panicum hallii var. hallii]
MQHTPRQPRPSPWKKPPAPPSYRIPPDLHILGTTGSSSCSVLFREPTQDDSTDSFLVPRPHTVTTSPRSRARARAAIDRILLSFSLERDREGKRRRRQRHDRSGGAGEDAFRRAPHGPAQVAAVLDLRLGLLLRLPRQWRLRGIRLQQASVQVGFCDLQYPRCVSFSVPPADDRSCCVSEKQKKNNTLCCSYGWYFTFVQGFVYLALIRLQGFTMKQMVNPWRTYVRLSAVLMGSNGLTKGSLAFLNYPAQIMFKSTKVLPVMIMGAFIPGLRRKYPFQEYVSAVMLVIGLILFTLADAQTSPNFSMVGVAMVSGALVMDAFLGNLQEAIFKMNPDTTQMEMLFCSTVVGLPFLALPMVLTGELMTAWTSCSQHLYVYAVLVFEAMATFVGQVSVLSLIALFGAATTAMVTTARKAVTLLLSYLIFTKPLTEQHVTGLLLITMGIVLKLLPENQEGGPRRQAKKVERSYDDDKKRVIRELEEEKTALV